MTDDKRDRVRPAASDRDSYLERCLRVLEAVALQPAPSTLARISQRSDLPLSTVHRLVQVLEGSGVVQRVGRRYRIGGRLVAITAHGTLERRDQNR
ncbi:helix-turn-helix domain-containing protein [Saccharothrix syringae]|uniref:HTH iclR-type domain-containing protein n=1 Tax=Saccharothrix syringae TaxID=103733 RepID=A0A5Q0H2V9_SACSY|nr:helix-turn-helix domain-containing protein [Saccharothrix syringae]QFZ20577.1 hypothetical protein EKG83_27045 [Saccharothrix syringae]